MLIHRVFLFIGGALLVSVPASAHHSFAAHYRVEETVSVTGVVTQFRFVNPHVRVYLDVMNEDGEIEHWMAEGDAAPALRRTGWTAEQFKPGDIIEIVGSPSRDGSNMLGWDTIRLPDGSDIGGGDGRLEERLRILEERLTESRRERVQ